MMQQQGYLYVEDDPLSRKAMKMIIEKELEEAVDLFEDSHDFMARLAALNPSPKVILLDIHIQPYSGFELLKMIRTLPEYDAVPVVALTASVMNEEVSQLREAGFNGAIAKPFSIRTLPDWLRAIQSGESVWKITE
jgi:CheY-like chemotaxis protein